MKFDSNFIITKYYNSFMVTILRFSIQKNQFFVLDIGSCEKIPKYNTFLDSLYTKSNMGAVTTDASTQTISLSLADVRTIIPGVMATNIPHPDMPLDDHTYVKLGEILGSVLRYFYII